MFGMCLKKVNNDPKYVIANWSVGLEFERWNWVLEKKLGFQFLLVQVQDMGNDYHGLSQFLSYIRADRSCW